MDEFGIDSLVEGGTYEVQLRARSPKGDGIGRLNDVIIFVKNAKARIGKTHKIRITKLHRTFAYAELAEQDSKYFIGNGSLIV